MILEQLEYPFRFDASKCSSCAGNCCIGESGFIWITIDEIEKLAIHLNVSVKEVFDNYLIKYDYKFSIKERKIGDNNFACIFFDLDKKQCSIYEARPTQCRTFPFWEHFKNNVEEVKQECPAIIE
jgi:Fe-S-cluster containining protein